MNFKRYSIATIALFVFFFLYGWVVHGHLLKPLYQETPHLWRTHEGMEANFPLMLICEFLLAAWLAYIFTQFFPDGSIRNGFRFGLSFAVFAAILMGMSYIWMPISQALGWGWFAASFVEYLIGGLILGAIYQRD